MIRVIYRNTVEDNENKTIKEFLEEHSMDYSDGVVLLDGARVEKDNLDKTFAELGAVEHCSLLIEHKLGGCYGARDGELRLCSECNKYHVICAGAGSQEQRTISEVLKGVNEPTEFLKGKVFSLMVDFINNDNFYDETFFDIDCTTDHWRKELTELWNDFRKENDLPENCVTEVWSTFSDDEYPCGDPDNPDRLCADCEYQEHCIPF